MSQVTPHLSPARASQVGLPRIGLSAAGQSASGWSALDCSDQGSFVWWLGLQRFGSRQVVVLPQVGVICVVSCWLPDLTKVGSDISLAAPNLEVGTFHI